jgi:hypothetical protein
MTRPASYLVLSALFLFAPLSKADSFYTLVRYECVPASSQIIISYVGAYNEAGQAMINTKGANEWDPWTLVKIRDDDNRTEIVGIREVKKTCKLRDGVYTVTIRPSPGNLNLLGECGSHISAGVRVSRANRRIIDTDFEYGGCLNSGLIVTKVVVSAGQESASVTKVEWNDFYK